MMPRTHISQKFLRKEEALLLIRSIVLIFMTLPEFKDSWRFIIHYVFHITIAVS